jgi:hypothetical protein
MVVATAILGALVLAGVATYGSRPVTAHSGAIALEQAMAEARSLAAANSDTTDLLHPSGATVIVEPDPSGLHGSSRIAVYRSRPVVFNGQTPYPPIRDVGFPPQRVSATFTFTGSSPDGASTVSEPFAIMLSGSGYASIQHFTGSYDETAPTYWSSDPGCPADGARIAVADGVSSEGHAFGCVGGFYAAN